MALSRLYNQLWQAATRDQVPCWKRVWYLPIEPPFWIVLFGMVIKHSGLKIESIISTKWFLLNDCQVVRSHQGTSVRKAFPIHWNKFPFPTGASSRWLTRAWPNYRIIRKKVWPSCFYAAIFRHPFEVCPILPMPPWFSRAVRVEMDILCCSRALFRLILFPTHQCTCWKWLTVRIAISNSK